MNEILVFLFLFLLGSLPSNAEQLVDEVANKLPRAVAQPVVYKNYDYESTVKIPVKLKPIQNIKSELDVYEGQYLDFKVAKDVLYDNQIVFRRGEIIAAKVSVIISPGMNGIPASIVLKDFDIKDIADGQMSDSYEVFGQDRSLLVFPLKWALTILPPTGSLTNFIMGGHAKLKIKKPITVYYYPEWK